MKRVILAVTATVLGLIALLSFKSQGQPLATTPGGLPSAVAPAATTPTSTAKNATTGAAPTSSAPPDPSAAHRSAAARPARYVGSAVQTRYGVVQVAVTVAAKRIKSVSFVQLTAFDQHSADINSQAAPILLHETVSAQSGHIDTVSGATYTSDGYQQSLQSALDQAGIR
jgi:uncharacterized protein with FMN-binding domain